MDFREDSFWFLWDCFQGNPSSANLAGVVRLTLIKVLVLGVDEGGGDGMWGAGVSCYEEEVSTWVKKEAKMRVWWWMMEGGRGKRSSWRKYLVEKMWWGGSGGVNSVIVWICECMYVFYGGRAMCNGVAEMISESGCVWVKWAGKRYRW